MNDAEDRRTEIALFRYTLILPLLRGDYPPGGKQRLREHIASRHHDIPHSSRSTVSPSTLARWERLYLQDGFDGLKPKPRSDRGQPRAISKETLDRAETLKREQPRRSARSIINILSLDQTNPIPEESIAPRTLRRRLALRDATTPQLLNEQRPKSIGASSITISGTSGRAMPCTVPISPTLPIPVRNDRCFYLPSSTITRASCSTPRSVGSRASARTLGSGGFSTPFGWSSVRLP